MEFSLDSHRYISAVDLAVPEIKAWYKWASLLSVM
jgi:hypothetical protein